MILAVGKRFSFVVLVVVILFGCSKAAKDASKTNNQDLTVEQMMPNTVDVDPNTEIIVTFNKTIDPLTVADTISVIGEETGAVLGQLSVDATQIIYKPNWLHYEETYQVTVNNNFSDLTGKSLDTELNWQFTTIDSPAIKLEGDLGSTTYDFSPKSVSNDAGDVLVVWKSMIDARHPGQKLIYAVYDAASTQWLPEQTLSITQNFCLGPDNGCQYEFEFAVASDGVGFGVVWAERKMENSRTYAELKARFYSAGSWSDAIAIPEKHFSLTQLQLASAGGQYLAVWSENENSNRRLYSIVFTGVTLGQLLPIDNELSQTFKQLKLLQDGSSYLVAWEDSQLRARLWKDGWQTTKDIAQSSSGNFSVANNGNGYQIAWATGDVDVMTIGYHQDSENNHVWSTETTIDTGDNNVSTPLIVSNGNDYCICWEESNYDNPDVICSVGTDDMLVGTAVENNALFNTNSALSVAGANYVVVWSEFDTSGFENLNSSYFNGAWNEQLVEEKDLVYRNYSHRFSRIGADLIVTWVQQTGTGGAEESWYRRFTGGAWQPEGKLVEDVDRDWFAIPNERKEVVFVERNENNEAKMYAGFNFDEFAANPVTSLTALTNTVQHGDAVEPVIVTNDVGEHMAVWVQQTAEKHKIYARRIFQNNWDPIKFIAEGYIRPYTLKVATNGTGFAIVWAEDDETATSSLGKSVFYNGGWTNIIDYKTADAKIYTRQIISNGDSYMMDYLVENNLNNYFVVFDGMVWKDEQYLNSVDTHSSFGIASNGTHYAIIWLASVGDIKEINSMFYTTQWSDVVLITSGTAIGNRPMIISNGNNYLVTWIQVNGLATNLYASLFVNEWQPSEPIDLPLDDNTPLQPYLKGYDDFYVAAWVQEDDVYANIHSTNGWSGPTPLNSPTRPQAVRIETNGNGFLATWLIANNVLTPENDLSLMASVYDGSSWSTAPEPMELLSTPVFGGTAALVRRNYHLNLIGDEQGYAVVWEQEKDGLQAVLFKYFDGVQWGDLTTLSTFGSGTAPSLAEYQQRYSLIWLQADSEGDHSVFQPWVRTLFKPKM